MSDLTADDLHRAIYECVHQEITGKVPTPLTDTQVLNAEMLSQLVEPKEPRELTPEQHAFEQAVFRKAMNHLRGETDKMQGLMELIPMLPHEECVCLTDALGIPGEPMIDPEIIEAKGLAHKWPYNPLPKEWLDEQAASRKSHNAVMEFTRQRVRRDPFYGPIHPVVPITDEELDQVPEDEDGEKTHE